ncbi:MAG: prepilin-type N-terminal cleavage/methylation domain-containing protein [Alphaproteobacteria bacterium]|nr:prepilin-type N-terminal cleavage/methylation domain-containing protein [Alphaproteobacteria bacterium]
MFLSCFKKKITGFTLIELLITIAILGILSTIAYTNLSGGTERAEQAKIKTEVQGLRAVALIYKADNASYTGLCAATTDFYTQLLPITTPATTGGCITNGSGSTYVAFRAYPVARGSELGWCIDSTGKSKAYTTTPTTFCP